MQFIDLGRQYKRIENELKERWEAILNKQAFIMGDEILEMEQKLADFCGRRFCLSCGSGTDALIIPLMAYELKKTDAVFVPSFTFFASAESVVLAGATPVFVDVDENYNMDPQSLLMAIDKVKKEGKLTAKGVIPVDLFGRSANYLEILPIAKEFNLFVLEDAAQGFGGSLNGKRNGSFGDVSATSFFPAKPLGCYGDGGAIFTDNEALYKKMASIRVHGHGTNKYDNVRIGINGRMDTLQAAVILEKLKIFEEELEKRQQIVAWYTEELQGSFVLPEKDSGYFSSWAQYTLRATNLEQRDRIISKMRDNGVPLMIYYPIPLHLQKAFAYLDYCEEDLPNCSRYAKQVFSVPMHPYLEKEEVKYICNRLKESICFYKA